MPNNYSPCGGVCSVYIDEMLKEQDVDKPSNKRQGLQREEFALWRDILAAGRFPWHQAKDWPQPVSSATFFELLEFYFKELSGDSYVDDFCNGSVKGAQVRMGWTVSEFCTPLPHQVKDPSPQNIKLVANKLKQKSMQKFGSRVQWFYTFGPVPLLRTIFEARTKHSGFWNLGESWEILPDVVETRWSNWAKSNPAFTSKYEAPASKEP